MRQPNPERGYLWKLSPSRSAPTKKIMNIYGSLMDIFDPKKHIVCITYYLLLITCPHIVCIT